MRILIVDDDRATVDAIEQSIDWKSLGVEAVEIAYSAAQAKKILLIDPVDIVVSDIEMPQVSGLELLAWVREQKDMDVAFVLLTCHEKFDYATSAIRLSAAEYLTKPFDAEMMTLSLHKVINDIKHNKKLKESSRYGIWREQNEQAEEHHFWLTLYNGETGRQRHEIRREVEARGLSVDVDPGYRLIVSKICEYEDSEKALGKDLLFFLLEGIYSRILCGREENYRTIRRFDSSGFWLFVALADQKDVLLKERCGTMIQACSEATQATVTTCIGKACDIEALPDKLSALSNLIDHSTALYGQAFTEDEAIKAHANELQIMEMGRLEQLLLARNKISILNYIKEILNNRIAMRTLTERTLYLLQQEFLQGIYAYLTQAGVQATQLFHDEDSVRLADKACHSAVHMLRWSNYLLENAFAAEEHLRKSTSLIERIHAFIHSHYQEEIDRNKIAAEFHLAPEYLAKLYHKKTGKYLKDTLREYRVEQAKRLLRDEDVRVSDIAAAVGFDNFSYFSAVFKKMTGLTPQEYRRSLGTDYIRE